MLKFLGLLIAGTLAHAGTFLITDNGNIPGVTQPDPSGGSHYLFSPSCSLYTCSFEAAKDMWALG